MGEPTISPKALEDAMLKALPTLFPHLLGTTNSARVDFYDKFQREADEYDRDFMKKYDEDLNTTLIFAGLFSAVASAFIIDVESSFQPDYTQLSYTVLTIIANTSLGHPPTDLNSALPQWIGPDPTIVHVQAILYSSLAASLLAAFIAMLGKQWLNRYSQVEMRGSVIDRSRHRQRKMNGMVTWRFDLVMECLPLMLQAALLLLGYALSQYLFTIDKVIAGVTIGFTVFGLLFYLLIVSAATFSYNCPFQTPASLIIRFMICFDDEHRRYLKRTKKWFVRTFLLKKTEQGRQNSVVPNALGRPNTFNTSIPDNQIELAIADQPTPLFNKETDWNGYVLDSNCIAWLSEMSMDADVILAIMKFIPEVVWHDGIRTIPLEKLYDTVLECFDRSSGIPVVIPKLRDKAYLSAKALLYLAIQRKCIGHESDSVVFTSISSRHSVMGSKRYEEDSDLESTLNIIDRVFGNYDSIHWSTFTFSAPHHAWMAHTLLYRAWDVLGKGSTLPDDIKDFVLHSLRPDPPPPAPIVTDCLFIIGLVLGLRLHIDDLLVHDKSHEHDQQIFRIFEKLVETIKNPNASSEKIDCALEAIELIVPLCEFDIAQKNFDLFHVVMQTPLTDAYTEERKWNAARLTMHGAYKWTYFPRVKEPQDVLDFLDHHFRLAAQGGETQDGPIKNALRAIAYASDPVAIEAFKRFDPTEPSFVRGVSYAYHGNRPLELRKAALFLLPLIGDRWFNTPDPIMEPDQMRALCVDWASAVDSAFLHYDSQKATLATLAVLFGMINSPHWRPHIVSNKWKLLEHFTLVPDDSQPLRRCLDNPTLTNAIAEVENPVAMVLWLAILWLKYKELIPEVREQLEMVTKEVAQGSRRTDLDWYLSVMDSELKKAEDALAEHKAWSVDPAVVALRTKIDHLQQAKVALHTIKSQG